MADEFTAADFAPSEADEFTAADFAPRAALKVSGPPTIALSPYEQADIASMEAGRGKALTGMEPTTELTTALATGVAPPSEAGELLRRGVSEVANIPTYLSNVARGRMAGMPGYVEPKTPEDVAAFGEALERPFVPIPKFDIKPEDKGLTTFAKEAANVALSLPEFFETPLGLMTMGAAGTGEFGAMAVRRAFLADMMKNMAQQYPQMIARWPTMTDQEKMKAVVDLSGTAVMTGLLASPEMPKVRIGAEEPARFETAPPFIPPMTTPTPTLGPAPMTAPLPVSPEREVEGAGAELLAPRRTVLPGEAETIRGFTPRPVPRGTVPGMPTATELQDTGPITSAAYLDDRGQVHYGANHPEILKRLGLPVPPRDERNTYQFGYGTENVPYVPRSQAGPIAEKYDQKLETFDEGDTQPHSDQIAAKPGSETPLAETRAAPAARAFVDYKSALESNDPDAIDFRDAYNEWAKRRVGAPEGEGGVRSPEQRALDDEAIDRFGTDTNVPEIGWEQKQKRGFRWNRETKRFEKPGAEPPPAAPAEPFRSTIAFETYDEPSGQWQAQSRPIVISKSTIPGDKPWRATVFAGPEDAPVAIGHIQLDAPMDVYGKPALAALSEQLGRYTRNIDIAKPAPAEPAPPSLEEQAQASMKKSEEEYFQRQADKGRKPKATLAQVIEQRGRQGVEELLDEWTQGAELSEDGKSIRAPLDPRESGKLTKVPARDFLLWLEDRPEAPAPKVPEPAAPISTVDPRTLSDADIASEVASLSEKTSPLYDALEKMGDDAFLPKSGKYTPEAQAIDDKIKPLARRKELLQHEQARRDMEARNKAAMEARDKRVAAAPVWQTRNGWEIIKEGVDYVLRDPFTKEDVYRGKLSRVREVADESRPEKPAAPEPAAKEPWQMTRKEWEDATRKASAAELSAFKALGGSPLQKSLAWGTPERIRLQYGAEAKPIRKRGVPVVTHRNVIEKALAEGKPVPAEVLADYPDLKPAAPAAEAPKAPAAGGKAPESGRVTYRAPATGKKSRWVKVAGDWFRADSQWKPKGKALEPMGLRDALERQLTREQVPPTLEEARSAWKATNMGRSWKIELPGRPKPIYISSVLGKDRPNVMSATEAIDTAYRLVYPEEAKPPAPAAPQTAAAKVETPAAKRTYEVSFESPSGGRATVSVRRVKFDELPDSMKKLIEEQLKVYHTLQDWKEIDRWEKVKNGKTPVTLWEKREGEEVTHNISLESPETEFKNWAMREDLYDKKYNAAGQGLRDKLLAEREATEKAAEDKRKAEEAETTKKIEDFAKYRAVIETVPLPKGETQMMRVVSQKGDESFIRGVKYGDWFIHKVEGGKGRYAQPTVYKVSHFASGLGISGDGLPSLQAAKNYVRALIHGKARGNWIRADQLTKAEKAHLMEIGRAWAAGGDVPSYFKAEATPPPPPSMAGPGMVGMGAETAEEFLPAATTATSIKNAVVDQERARRGLPPAFEPIRRSFGEVWDRAMALIDRDPSYQDRLISELKAKPRALTDTEDAALLHRQVDLQNEYGKATRDLAQSYADGRTEAVEADKARVAALSDALLDLYNVGKTSGTETGRGLNARKMMANEDFTLASMEMQSRAAKGGRPLTDAEREQLVVLEKQIAATQKAYDEYVSAAEERQRNLETDLALARTKAEAAAEPKYAPRVIQLAEKFATFMDSRANEALARLKARRAEPRAFSGGLDPADLDDLAIVGAAKITRGAFELAKWSDAMIRDVGEWVRPHLQAVWDAANKVFSLETSKLERQEGKAIAGAVKKKAAAPTPKDEIGKLGEQIRDKVEKKELDKINWYVRKLARVFYQQGITEREAMVDALHDVLKDILPDWTRRQTADAFSGYGDFKPLSKDAITVALRGMKGELQQLAKLEDMAAGQPPLKSGLERRTPTEVERQLIKRVNDAKYKFQIPVQDPGTQLKSALDTMKTSLRNRITDYEDRLARRDFTARPRRKIELDPEATRLKAQAERTKDKFREALIADRLANRTKWEKALDWGTKYRRFGVLSSIRVIPKLLSAGLQRLASMPLEELAGSAWELAPAVRRVGEKAPLEGGGRNWRAEASGFARAFTQGMKDAYDVIHTGRSEMDVLYGKSTDNYIGEAEFGSKLLSFPGRVHGMIKVPVKRAAFERAVQRLADYYARQGLDVTDELVKTRIAVEAYKAGNRAIFLNNNFVADKINAFLALKVDPTTGKPTLGSKVWATGGRIVLPIVRVPVNIVAETMQYAGGLVSGNLRLANAFRKGIETLQPEQADLIMRELKKGSVGAAVLLLGYFNADKVGGYYQPGQKRDPRDVKAGNLRIFGVQIPSWLMHNPLLETLQVGATVRRVADSKLRKKDTQVQGLASGVWAAALGMTEQVPFVRGMADYEKLRNPYTRGEFGGEYVKGLVVPSAIQQAAQWTDPLDPRLQRKPTTLGQHIATGIPGLRQRVPTAPVKGRVAAVPQPVLDAVTIRP